MTSIKAMLSNSLIVFVSAIAGFALIELILQLTSPDDPLDATRQGNVLRDFEFNYQIAQLYDSNAIHADYRRDEFGLRDDCQSPEDIEILTVGGSTTDQRYVPFKSTYQEVMESQIYGALGSFGCVSNAGVDGHSTLGHLFSFDNWFPLIDGLSPNYILLYVGVNDVSGTDELRPASYSWIRELELVSQLTPIYRFLSQSANPDAWTQHSNSDEYFSEQNYRIESLSEDAIASAKDNSIIFAHRFETLVNEVYEFGAKPICVTQPHRYVIENDEGKLGLDLQDSSLNGLEYDFRLTLINMKIKEICGDNTFDLYSKEFEDHHFYDGVHTTDSGSARIGELMANFFLENF